MRSVLAIGVLVVFGVVSGVRADEPSAMGVAGPSAPEIAKPETIPHSARLGLPIAGEVPAAWLPWVDNAALIADDEVNPPPCKSLRYGRGMDLRAPASGGRWIDVPAGRDQPGGRLWVMDVVSPSALGLRLHLTGLDLPPGASIVVYAPSAPEQIFGPYEDVGPVGDGQVWSPTIWSGTVRVECFVPEGARIGRAPVKIGRVQHVYRPLGGDPLEQFQDVGNCHNDVTCFPAWANTAKAVAGIGAISQANSIYCTGQLLATQNADQTPYFLTANHCVSTASEASTVEVYWFYQTSACNGAVPAISTTLRSKIATLVSTATPSDYCLLMIEGSLPAGVFFAGWTSTVPANGTAVVGIHHPDGSWKRYSSGTKASNTTCGGSNHIRCNWSSGVTEPGSSGSGLFRSDTQQLVGQLHCGSSACGVASQFLNDDYGQFSTTYAAISASLAAGSDDALEENDSCAAARLVLSAIGTGTNNGLIVKKVDEDWYRYSVPSGTRLTVSLSFTHANGDIDMQLFTACGGSVVAQSVSTTNAESVQYTNNGATQDVFVRVFLSGTDTRNTYSMTSTIAAVTPANNACAAATGVTIGTYTGTTASATIDGPSGCSGAGTAPDVWYSYTAAAFGTLILDTCGSAYDTLLSVHSACPGTAANQLACNDDASFCGSASSASWIALAVNPGQNVRIRVGGYQGASGLFTLHVNFVGTPDNDACAAATPVGNGATAFSTVGATNDGPSETLCNFFGTAETLADTWFVYTAGCTGPVNVRTCGSSFDTKAAVYGAACPAGANSALACNDDSDDCGSGSLSSSLTFNAVNGQSYRIRVGSLNGTTGSGVLTITPSCPTACPADVASAGNPSLDAGPDGFLTGDDFDVFVQCFFTGYRNASNVLVADITDDTGTGGPDGFITGADFDRFIVLFFSGCP